VNKGLFALVLLASAVAAADPAPAASPWGSSPNVVSYAPPAIVETNRAHHGVTFEASVFEGTSSTEKTTTGLSAALGLWVAEPVALAFRMTGTGKFFFVGGSVQFEPKQARWFAGAGVGQLAESTMDVDGYNKNSHGLGGFARAGYNIVGGNPHALYVSGELQAGQIEDRTRVVGVVALGYQLL
jgi:hypothetical protein